MGKSQSKRASRKESAKEKHQNNCDDTTQDEKVEEANVDVSHSKEAGDTKASKEVQPETSEPDETEDEGEILYQNIPRKNSEGRNVYHNIQEGSGKRKTGRVVYTDVEIVKSPTPGGADDQAVHRMDDPVEYAAIDFTKNAPPAIQEETK